MFKYRRVTAFLIDVLFVALITMMLSSNPKLNKAYEYQGDYIEAYKQAVESLPTTSLFNEPKEILNTYTSILALPMVNMIKVQAYTYVIFIVVLFLYYVIFTYFNDGKTLGCALCKLKITKRNDDKVGLLNLMIRSLFMGSSLIYLVPIVCIIYIIVPRVLPLSISFMVLLTTVSASFLVECIFILYFLLNKNNMTLQDYISNTKVIDTKK